MVSSTEIYKNDSIAEWLRKTNLLITDTIDYSILIGNSLSLDEQFKLTNFSDVATFSSGVLRKKKDIFHIKEKSISPASNVCVFYIDLNSIDTSPIKSISIESATDPFHETVSSFNGQSVFVFPSISAPSSVIVWLSGTELVYGIDKDYIVSGNSVIINNPSQVFSGDVVSLANIDTTNYDSLVDILPIYRMGGDNITDLRTWAFTNRDDINPFPKIPFEFYAKTTTPQDTFDLGDVFVSNSVVYVDGYRKRENIDYQAQSDHILKFYSPLPIDTTVTIFGYVNVEDYLQVTVEQELVATTNGQTIFTFTDFDVDKKMALWVDGIRQNSDSFSVDSITNTITLVSGVSVGVAIIGGINLPSDGKPFFYGGSVDQTIRKNSNIDFDWSWVDTEFSGSVFDDSISDFAIERIPIAPTISADTQTETITTPKYVKYSRLPPTWKTSDGISPEDLFFVGQSGDSGNGIGEKNENLLVQRCGRIVRLSDGKILPNKIKNPPLKTTSIDVWREPTGLTLNVLQNLAGIVVGCIQGKAYYCLNISGSDINPEFGDWVDLNVSFPPNYEIVDICVSSVATDNIQTTSSMMQYVFISAYNKLTNQSCVRWKLATDLTSPFIMPWNFYVNNTTTFFTGKITNFASDRKMFTNINVMSRAVVKWAIGDTVFTFDEIITVPKTNVNNVNNSVSTIIIAGENIIDISGSITRCKLTGTPVEERVWFAIADSGKIYRQTTQLATPNSPFIQCSEFVFGKPRKTTTMGRVETDGSPSLGKIKHLIIFDGGVAEFDYTSAAGNEKYKLSKKIVGDSCEFIAQSSHLNTLFTHIDRSNVIIQTNQLEVLNILSKNNLLSNAQEDILQKTEHPFMLDGGFIPPIETQNIISNGSTHILVANSPYNCMWVMGKSKSFGNVIPFSGDTIGAFYEQNKFIVITTKYIYSSSDGMVWNKVSYSCPIERSGMADMTASTINGQPIWVIANNIYGAYSYDGVNWTTVTNSIIPDGSISSDGVNMMCAVDLEGYLIFSEDGVNWNRASQGTFVTAIDARTGFILPDTLLQYDGIDENLKYLAVQYTTDGGFFCSRSGVGNVLSYKNPTDIIQYVPTTVAIGSGEPLQTFRNGNVATNIYGKNYIFARTAKGEIYFTFGISRGAYWFRMQIPVHSYDIPTGISYDEKGNHFIGTMEINHINGKIPTFSHTTL